VPTTQLGAAVEQGGDQSSCFLTAGPSTSRHVSFSLQTLERDPNFVPDSTVLSELQRRSWCSAARGCAALEVFSSRRQALTLLRYCTASIALPNVRAKLAPTVGRAGQVGENVQGTADLARVARRWGST
jgi:hypothetical protein